MSTRIDRSGARSGVRKAASRTTSTVGNSAPDWVERAARGGYAAKGVVYAVIGGLAVAMAAGAGGGTSGSRGALEQIASAPFGTAVLAIVTVGLIGYVVWRLVQAFVDPEADSTDDGTGKRIAKRLFYFLSAVLYGALAYAGARLVLSGGGGSGGGSGAGSGGGSSQGMVAELMSMSWGVWLVGAVGVAVVIRGLIQLWKAYTEKFREKLGHFDVGATARKWILRAARLGLTARAVVFGLIGGSIIYAAITHDPNQARGLEGALDSLADQPWLLGAVGAGLVGYAIYQWTKARYRLIGV